MVASKLHILLADDDEDDRFFFEMALNASSLRSKLTMVTDGEKLMAYLHDQKKLPDVLFLDLNMPKMHGAECLAEIKKDTRLKGLPVIIQSTASESEVTEKLYNMGAHYYCKKTGADELQQLLGFVLPLVSDKKLERPERRGFILVFRDMSVKA
ncbi:MAG: rcp1 2 [Bacteroidetes bacterium]|nr:rcp1 2 [Bacteroidota bacterium]